MISSRISMVTLALATLVTLGSLRAGLVGQAAVGLIYSF